MWAVERLPTCYVRRLASSEVSGSESSDRPSDSGGGGSHCRHAEPSVARCPWVSIRREQASVLAALGRHRRRGVR